MNKVKKYIKYKNNSKGFAPLALLIIIVLVIFGIGYYLYKSGYSKEQSPSTVTQISAPQINLDQVKITITKNGFEPATVKIKKGQTVEWVNEDVKDHQIAPDPHPAHTSLPALAETDPIESEESMSFIFEQTGTYTYHDHLNPLKFKGAVIVEG